jgi:hypothetical protein
MVQLKLRRYNNGGSDPSSQVIQFNCTATDLVYCYSREAGPTLHTYTKSDYNYTTISSWTGNGVDGQGMVMLMTTDKKIVAMEIGTNLTTVDPRSYIMFNCIENGVVVNKVIDYTMLPTDGGTTANNSPLIFNIPTTSDDFSTTLNIASGGNMSKVNLNGQDYPTFPMSLSVKSGDTLTVTGALSTYPVTFTNT